MVPVRPFQNTGPLPSNPGAAIPVPNDKNCLTNKKINKRIKSKIQIGSGISGKAALPMGTVNLRKNIPFSRLETAQASRQIKISICVKIIIFFSYCAKENTLFHNHFGKPERNVGNKCNDPQSQHQRHQPRKNDHGCCLYQHACHARQHIKHQPF